VLKATTQHWKLAEGLAVILIVLMLPNGVRQLLSMVLGSSDPQPRAKTKAVTEAGHG
jgi:branched-chain amino acid transport system permease protein